MHGAGQRVVAVTLALLLVFPVLGVGIGQAAGAPIPPVRQTSIAAASQVERGDSITQTQTYALTPNRPDEVTVTLTYDIPDRVVNLTTQIPRDANVIERDGFRRRNQTTYAWDERTAVATIEYRIDPTRRIDSTGPEGADGEYIAADAGDWALIQRSQTPTRWSYRGRELMTFDRRITTAGPGAAGDQLVYLGAIDSFERTANEQTFRLVVPEAASLEESPDEILAAMTNASNGLRVGDRDSEVFIVAAPTDGIDWGVRGLQTGDADIWVRDTERLDTADNVWIHEYVHSRQQFRTTEETRWLTEGSATYYAAVLSLEQQRINFTTFEDRLDEGSRTVYDSVVLSEPDSWEENANYYKGPLAAGRIDERIRVVTDSERTLQDAIRLLNGNEQPMTQERFLAAVERVGEQSARQRAAELTTTDRDLDMWNESRHARVFGQLPARVGYRLPSADDPQGYHVRGPYRTVSVDGSQPIQLATGEMLTIDAIVSNAGGTEGQYNASLRINGTEVERMTGRISPGEQQIVPLSHTFGTPGRYGLSIDGENITVLVDRPARTQVSEVRVDTDAAVQGDIVIVTATVVNEAPIPAEGEVVFTRDFQTVAERQVYLPPQNTTHVSTEVTMTETGRVLLSAGSARAVQVIVDAAPETPSPTTTEPSTGTATPATPTPTAGDSGPSFTVIVTLLAIALTVVLALRRWE